MVDHSLSSEKVRPDLVPAATGAVNPIVALLVIIIIVIFAYIFFGKLFVGQGHTKKKDSDHELPKHDRSDIFGTGIHPSPTLAAPSMSYGCHVDREEDPDKRDREVRQIILGVLEERVGWSGEDELRQLLRGSTLVCSRSEFRRAIQPLLGRGILLCRGKSGEKSFKLAKK